MTAYGAELRAHDGTVTFQGEVEFTDPADEPFAPGVPGAVVLRGPFAFDHTQAAALAAGVPLLTPAIGDVILDAWFEIDAAFDGTTPHADLGTFDGGNDGLFGLISNTVDLTKADAAFAENAGLLRGAVHVPHSLSASEVTNAVLGTQASTRWPLAVTVANPLLLVASQDGLKGGTALDSTVGAGKVFVLMATPLGK